MYNLFTNIYNFLIASKRAFVNVENIQSPSLVFFSANTMTGP